VNINLNNNVDIFENKTISIIDIFLIFAKHIKLIFFLPTILCSLSIVYLLLYSQPLYTSNMKFMSSELANDTSGLMGVASQFGFQLPNNSNPQWSYKEIIKSRTMAKKILKYRFDTDLYGPNKELLQILTFGNEKPEFGIDTLINQGIVIWNDIVNISKDNLTSLYTLEVIAAEPKLSSEIASVIINELDKYQRDYNAMKTTETREFIESRLNDTNLELEKAEEKLKNFRERNRNILTSPKLQMHQDRLVRDVSVLLSVFTTLKQQLETAKIDEVKESDYIIILDDPEIPIHPSAPRKKMIVIMVGLFSVFSSMIIAFLIEYIKNIEDAQKIKINELWVILKNKLFSFK
tara:strand:+ start:61 stop:1107 length:1047 start_codon:yes stop_codon:yes gene_type:complete